MAVPTDLSAQTFAERERLAALLADLTPDQWNAPSLCAGWRVREVVAHITLPFRTGPMRFAAGLAAARFSVNRYADTAARRDGGRMTDAELLAALRDNVRHPWQPPGGGQAGALSHDVIHGLDLTEPLGLPSAPPDRIAAVLAHADGRALTFFGVDLTGLTLRATDTDITFGTGATVVELPARTLLLTVTGRRPLPVTTGAT
ncbi:maleylpyruvate isomerase family mycothiol-dependent enzyme [Streptacidiphilus jiangxiensis]|uniref:TIGR03083 family protein n=1 Tax=Streptacidiphilus jiangxiensis TaxID=235985 RepID=A0A1H7SA99_STRJI|nr:maleylpyruvate isomerase family mycothiol-dependent enzyme [Streptacidiphilus jiangxiensis]SEL69209.1 TIGR03083 family protein [Streptacidiphilus jiangxiensis]